MDAIRFAIDYSTLRLAYSSSKQGLKERSRSAETITREAWGLGPGEDLPSGADEHGWSLAEDFWLQVGEVEHDSGTAHAIIREAFVIGLFHLWERHANQWCARDAYDQKETLKQLKAIGRHPLEDELLLLSLVANCLKHGPSSNPKRACNQLHALHSELFDLPHDGVTARPCHKTLVLTDELLERFFQAVIQSGPPASIFNEDWPLSCER